MSAVKNLAEMRPGSEGTVSALLGGRKFVSRLAAMGITVGVPIKKVAELFMKGPVIIRVRGTEIAVGYGMALKIEVETE